MKYIPENRKILIIQENSDSVIVMNEDFEILSKLESSKIVPTVGPSGTSKENQAAKASKVEFHTVIKFHFIRYLCFNLLRFNFAFFTHLTSSNNRMKISFYVFLSTFLSVTIY